MIVHLDADAFFASVEQAADPRLRGKPVAVGGQRRGVIASPSYEARRFGVHTAMPTARARKLCPRLIVLPGDFERYELFSKLMFSYAYDFTPEVEISSIDEGYFDLRGHRKHSPPEVAAILRKAIGQSLKISVSEGIGANKLIAHISSKLKKPGCLIQVPAGGERSFLAPLPNEWLPGVGPHLSGRLNSAGLAQIGQVAAVSPEWLSLFVGAGAGQLWRFANGIDERPVTPIPPEAKSYSEQKTFDQDLTDEELILATLRSMADRLMAKVRLDRKSVRTMTLKIRYNDMDQVSRSRSFWEPTSLETEVYPWLAPLLRSAWERRVSLRMVSLKLSHLYDGLFAPELPIDPRARGRNQRGQLAGTIDQLRKTFGPRCVMRGHDLFLKNAGRPKRPAERACKPVPPRPVAKAGTPLLNIKSYYSFLDSLLSIEDIVLFAAELKVPAVAITDPNLHGAVEFFRCARQVGIKPVIAAEAAGMNLYVRNRTGYANLCRILSDPAPTRKLLEDHREGLICVPADPASEVRYRHPADRAAYDILQSIRTLTLLRERHPRKRRGGSFDFFSALQRSDGLRMTREIADACEFEFELGGLGFPHYAPADGSSPAAFLRKLALEGLARRYPHAGLRLKNQIEEELSLISQVGYEEYFLLVWDLLQECKARGIQWITRGSAADSMVCYCLGISDVCPIRFDLYFKRFLNKERMALNKLPDIDIDFAHDRKDDVVDLVFEKYGEEHAAVVGGFSTYRARSAIADVAKVLGVSDAQIRPLTERISSYDSASEVKEGIADCLECSDLPWQEEPLKTAIDLAGRFDGFPRHPKMHPCGVVLSRKPIHHLTPVFKSNKGYSTTHLDMDSAEAMGLIKMDILGQAGLAVMRDTLKLLAGRGESVDLKSLAPWEDPQIWEMISSGRARGVHHIESPAMISLSKMCNARDIDRLIALVSIIRPGAANQNKKVRFCRRAEKLEPVQYASPALEPVLRSTFGVIAYEEHILQICETFAGLDPGRADLLRRALTREKKAEIEKLGVEFQSAARARGRSEPEIAAVWELVRGFQGYAFCRAHSTAYGIEAYEAAHLKRYYPAEFLSCVLTHGKGFYSRLVYSLECRLLGLSFLSPDVNISRAGFFPEGGGIRVSLGVVKDLTKRTLEARERELNRASFASLRDFYIRVRPSAVEMENLVRAGAFDSFGLPRTAQFWELRRLLQEMDRPGQLPLLSEAPARFPEVPLTEPSLQRRLEDEMELLGFTVSGHPLDRFPGIDWGRYCPVSELGRRPREVVTVCGIIIEDRLFHSLDGRTMKFITLCDRTGIIEGEIFAEPYRRWGLNTLRYPVVEVTATVEPFDSGRGESLRVHRVAGARVNSAVSR